MMKDKYNYIKLDNTKDQQRDLSLQRVRRFVGETLAVVNKTSDYTIHQL